MTLHNPGSIKLPPLEIEKMDALKKMENDQYISSFIDSKLLLDSKFNKLYMNLLKKSEEIFENIHLLKEDKYKKITQGKDGNYRVFYSIGSNSDKKYKSIKTINGRIVSAIISSTKPEWGEKEEEYDNIILNIKKEENKELKDKIVTLSHEIQDALTKFEKEKGKKLNILSHTLIYFCENCNNIISLGRVRPCTCSCGEKIKNASDVTPITVFHFNKELINFINKNCWLEYGVDNLLKKKQFTTLVGFYVLGHSGNWHEIDNIAESRKMNYRFFCECKSGKELKPKDIFVFSGKMGDIGCTRGYIFTTQNRIKKEIIRLARSKNIDIISKVLNKDTDELLKEIKEQ